MASAPLTCSKTSFFDFPILLCRVLFLQVCFDDLELSSQARSAKLANHIRLWFIFFLHGQCRSARTARHWPVPLREAVYQRLLVSDLRSGRVHRFPTILANYMIGLKLCADISCVEFLGLKFFCDIHNHYSTCI